MEITERFKDLEKEIQDQKLKINNIEERLKNAKSFINNIKDYNINSYPVNFSKISTEYEQDLKKEIYKQSLNVTNIDEKVMNTEVFIININNNTNPGTVKSQEKFTESYDNNENWEISSNDDSEVSSNTQILLHKSTKFTKILKIFNFH